MGSTAHLVKVASPVVGNALLIGALELLAATRVRVTVRLVRKVAAVVAPVALPEVGDAEPIPALELGPVFALATCIIINRKTF